MKEECKHEPIKRNISGVEYFGKIEVRKEDFDYLFTDERECKHCGEKIIKTWKKANDQEIR